MNTGQKDLWKEWFEVQGKMFDIWQEAAANYYGGVKELYSGREGSEMMNNWSKMQADIFDFWKMTLVSMQQRVPGSLPGIPGWSSPDNIQEFCRDWLKYMMNSIKGINLMTDMPLFTKTGVSAESFSFVCGATEVYSRFFTFWNEVVRTIPGKDNLEKLNEFSKVWQNNYNRVLESYFSVNLPEDIKELMKNPVEIAEMYKNLYFNFFEPWQNLCGDMQRFTAVINGDESAYEDFTRAWSKAYRESYGRFFKVTPKGIDRESFDALIKVIGKYIMFIEKVSSFSVGVFQSGHEVMETIIEDAVIGKNKIPQDINEFYSIWWEANDQAFDKLLDSDKFQEQLTTVSDAWLDFKSSCDEMAADIFVAKIPVPSIGIEKF